LDSYADTDVHWWQRDSFAPRLARYLHYTGSFKL